MMPKSVNSTSGNSKSGNSKSGNKSDLTGELTDMKAKNNIALLKSVNFLNNLPIIQMIISSKKIDDNLCFSINNGQINRQESSGFLQKFEKALFAH